MATTLIMVKASDSFKDAIAAYAFARNQTMSDLVRDSVAKAIGYDLSGDDALAGRGRTKQYANDKQRRDAANKRARERAEVQKKLVDIVMKQERLEGAEALERWLKDKGISLDTGAESEDTTAA